MFLRPAGLLKCVALLQHVGPGVMCHGGADCSRMQLLGRMALSSDMVRPRVGYQGCGRSLGAGKLTVLQLPAEVITQWPLLVGVCGVQRTGCCPSQGQAYAHR